MAELDQAKVEAFAGRMLGVLNDGFLAMMTSIGHRTGLFDTLIRWRRFRPEGVYLTVDIQASSHLADNLNHPLGPYLYSISTLHCMSVSLGLGGEGLGTMWGEQQARALLEEAGLGHVAVHRVEGDIFNNLYVARKR
jgi:hypothetical protein